MKVNVNNLKYVEALSLLRTLFQKIIETLDAFCGNGVIFRSSELNAYYTVFVSLIEEILDKEGFEELKEELPYLPDSLIGKLDGFDAIWEVYREKWLAFNGKIEKAYILAGSINYKLPQELVLDLNRVGHLNLEHAKKAQDKSKKLLDEATELGKKLREEAKNTHKNTPLSKHKELSYDKNTGVLLRMSMPDISKHFAIKSTI